jgi:two-component system, chemotaxis family, protein-glutamate methylesterase/glutaminase
MQAFKVLIVDDSPFMRKVFSDVIDADASFIVLATASNGIEAVDLALKLKPDIITMDLEMPQLNGIEALQRIMASQPTPVIMLSAVTDNGTRDTIKALQYGAIDFIRKPDRAVKLDIHKVGEQLLEKLHIALETMSGGSFRMLPAVEENNDSTPPPAIIQEASLPGAVKKTENKTETIFNAKVNTNTTAADPARTKSPDLFRKPESAADKEKKPESLIANKLIDTKRVNKAAVSSEKPGHSNLNEPPYSKTSNTFTHIVAIGTSTGGPRALHEVLTGIPADFPAPILVVQHMPPKFTFSLAQRLDNFCSIQVREAVDGEPVETATAYIAPGGRHMTLRKETNGKYRIQLSEEGPRGGHRPSVDVLFESLLGQQQLNRHVVLMTGMGSDGAKGMKALQTDGAVTTIAEAEQTCVVYGMPRSAVELGAVSHLLPLQGIASVLVQEVKLRKR